MFTSATSEFADADALYISVWLMSVVVAFALIFAVNSSIHSFLVVHYAKEDKVATSVGFYYMSNAAGRLLGTLAYDREMKGDAKTFMKNLRHHGLLRYKDNETVDE